MTPTPHPPTPARVLVVEDSSVFREMQALLLRQAGYGVWSFESPAAALAEVRQHPFDLALVDFELPGMNGAQFMHALREIQPNIPVIFISGSLNLQLVSDLTRQGASGIFRKPTNPRVLLEKIHETLARPTPTEIRATTNLESGISREPFVESAPSADRLAYQPRYVYGSSVAFRNFTHRLWRARDFRSVLLLQGHPGSPFELFARELIGLSVFRAGPTMVCQAGEFNLRRLCEILAPALLDSVAGTLIVHGVDEFNAEQQQMLNELIMMRGMFQPFARCFRLVLASTPRLVARVESGAFDEALYAKLSALSLPLPALAEMRGDVAVNSLRLLEHLQEAANDRTPFALTPAAAAWLDAQPWPGDYAQLAHTLYLAARNAPGAELDVPALEAGAQDFELDQQARDRSTGLHGLRPGPSIEIAAGSPNPREAVRVHPAHLSVDQPA